MHDTALLVTVFAVLGLIGLNALSYYSMKRMVLPDIIWVLLIGVLYGAIARFTDWGFPKIELKPDLVLWLFVPLLIFASTQKICLFHFRRVLLPASLAATVGILISMAVIASALHFGFQIGWLEALLFGAILSATDPLAVGALLNGNSQVTESQQLMIEGESILNDGFVVTVAGIVGALLFNGGSFHLGKSIIHLGVHILGALLVGLVLGRGARWLLRRWHENYFVLTTNITLALAFGSYALAEALGLSGILSVFAAALAYGYKPDIDDHNKHVKRHLWEYFEYLANSVLFFLLGTSFFQQTNFSALSFGLVIAGLVLLFLSRFIALLVLAPLLTIDSERLRGKPFWLLNFAGARGAVSIALILLLPDDFALKQTFLSLAFTMILFSLVVYPLVLEKILQPGIKKPSSSSGA